NAFRNDRVIMMPGPMSNVIRLILMNIAVTAALAGGRAAAQEQATSLRREQAQGKSALAPTITCDVHEIARIPQPTDVLGFGTFGDFITVSGDVAVATARQSGSIEAVRVINHTGGTWVAGQVLQAADPAGT